MICPKKVRAKKQKQEKTEQQLVEEYANKIINGKIARGHYDKRFNWHTRDSNVNKDLWLDNDFFFSVVFQSQEQKYAFLEAFSKMFNIKIEATPDERIQVVNGLTLAKNLNIPLKHEKMITYPYGDLDLRDFVLDVNDIGENDNG